MLVLSADAFGFSDTDGHTLAGVTIASPPADGTLALFGAPVQQNDFISLSDLNTAALTFMPAPNSFANAYTTIDFLVVDSGSDQTGKHIAASPSTLIIDVLPVNDAPNNLDVIGDLQIPENTDVGTIGSVVFLSLIHI